MKIINFVLVMILSVAVNGQAASEEGKALLDKINPAWQRLETLSQGYLTAEQQKTVHQLAFAAAAGDICEGFKVDKEKFVGTFEEFNDEKHKALSPEDQQLRERKLLVFYGIATGLFAAEAMLVEEDFCDAAEKIRANPEKSNYWEKKQ